MKIGNIDMEEWLNSDRWKVVIHKCRAPETGYWGEVPALPYSYAHGETFEECRANVIEAAKGHLGIYIRSAIECLRDRKAESGDLNEHRIWWMPVALSVLTIYWIIYFWYRDFSFYQGWSFWWRVVMDFFFAGLGFVLYAFNGISRRISAQDCLKKVRARIIIFWFVCMLALVFFGSFMPGKLVKSNMRPSGCDPGEWSRP